MSCPERYYLVGSESILVTPCAEDAEVAVPLAERGKGCYKVRRNLLSLCTRETRKRGKNGGSQRN